MRDVSQFVVVFPKRLIGVRYEEKRRLLNALRRDYPHYKFDTYPGQDLADEEEFNIIPMMGVLGDGNGNDDPDRVYMCKPLDPKVIPQMVRTLQNYEAVGTAVH